MNWIKTLDGMGRPLMRATLVVVLAGIGICVVIAFAQWAIFLREIPKLPAETLVIAALPFIQAMWDNWVREEGKKVQLAWQMGNAMPNPHGGPLAP